MSKCKYVLKDEKNHTGYKGTRLSNDNLASFPERLLKIWEKSGIIKVKPETKKENKSKKTN